MFPIYNDIHTQYGHTTYKNLANKIKNSEYYFDGIELISEKYLKDCPECYGKFFPRKIIKIPKIIIDERPH